MQYSNHEKRVKSTALTKDGKAPRPTTPNWPNCTSTSAGSKWISAARKTLPDCLEWKRQQVEPDHPHLSVRRQCELLNLNRSSLYYEPARADPEELELMARLDRLHTAHPFNDSRKLAVELGTPTAPVNCKRVQRERAAPSPLGAEAGGRPNRDPVQPTGECLTPPHGRGPPSQREEGGLKRVVRVGPVPEHPPTGAEHEVAVPPDEQLERGLVAVLCEPPEQFRVGHHVLGRLGEASVVRYECGG